MAFVHASEDLGRLPDNWYAVRVNANCERIVAAAMESKGLGSFFPRCWQYRRWANRNRKVERALIPGYVFGRFHCEKRLPILTIPGVAYIVGTSAGPLPVDPHELAAIRKVAASGATAEPWPFLKAGQLVTLENGPLRGVPGRLISVNANWKVVVSITLLQRSVAVEVERSWVRPASEYDVNCRLAGTA